MSDIEELAKSLSKGKPHKHFGPNATHEQALRFGLRSDGFHVGVRYRDDKVQKVASRLVDLGLFKFKRAKRYGDGTEYRTTEKGKAVLDAMKVNQ